MDSPKHLRVFLASPGDVPAERHAAREVAERINRGLGRELGWHIDLLGWEDTLPGAGRPQSIINQDVDACDLFIGLLHKKWGTPTGHHSSGFEEEFERASARKEDSDSPEIWLFFKTVDQELLDDPGENLQKVLHFKAAQQGRFLYKDVADTNEWVAHLTDYLSRYVAARSRRAGGGDEQQSVSRSEGGDDQDDLPTSSLAPTAARQQLFDAFSNGLTLLRDEELDVRQLDASVLIRLYLAGASWLSYARTGETLSVHALNLLYRHRDGVEPTYVEYRAVAISLVDNVANENVPGWYWLKHLFARTQEWLVVTVAASNAEVSARIAALELMTAARLTIRGPERSQILADLIGSTEGAVVSAALRYLAAVGEAEDLTLLDQLSSDSEKSRDVMSAKIQLLARHDPDRAYDMLLESVAPPRAAVDELENVRVKIDRDRGLRGLAHRDADVRRLSLARMSASRQLRKDDAFALLRDSVHLIRISAVEAILRHGWTFDVSDLERAIDSTGDDRANFDDERRIRDSIYESLPKSVLHESAEWLSLSGVSAYRALAVQHFADVADDVRENLANGFATLKTRFESKYRAEIGDQGVDALLERYSGVESFFRSEFARAALVGLARNGSPDDVRLAKLYLGDEISTTKTAALDVVDKFGTSDDLPEILTLLGDYFVKAKAARVAMKLSEDKLATAKILLANDDVELVKWAGEHLPAEASSVDLLKELLRSSSMSIRRAAVSELCRRLSRDEMESVLEEYVDQSHYFYNVPTWIDRWLYSKGRLRQHFVQVMTEV